MSAFITHEQLDELLKRSDKSPKVILRIDQFRDLVHQAKVAIELQRELARRASIGVGVRDKLIDILREHHQQSPRYKETADEILQLVY